MSNIYQSNCVETLRQNMLDYANLKLYNYRCDGKKFSGGLEGGKRVWAD